MKERINQCRAWAQLVPVLVLVFASSHAIGVETEFAGQFNLRGGYGDSVWYGSGELRLMPTLRLGRFNEVSLHHETVYLDNELIGINSGEPSLQFGSGIIPEEGGDIGCRAAGEIALSGGHWGLQEALAGRDHLISVTTVR